jgi:hypothetical protein
VNDEIGNRLCKIATGKEVFQVQVVGMEIAAMCASGSFAAYASRRMAA